MPDAQATSGRLTRGLGEFHDSVDLRWHPISSNRLLNAATAASRSFQKSATYVEGMALAYTMVDVLKQAGRDLTRERLMQVVENITETDNAVVLPGVTVRTTPTDHFPVTQMGSARSITESSIRPARVKTRGAMCKLAGS
jgi:hypothetical protein